MTKICIAMHTITSEEYLEAVLGAYARDKGSASVFLGSGSTSLHMQSSLSLPTSKSDICLSLDSVYTSSLCNKVSSLTSGVIKTDLERTDHGVGDGHLTEHSKTEFFSRSSASPSMIGTSTSKTSSGMFVLYARIED